MRDRRSYESRGINSLLRVKSRHQTAVVRATVFAYVVLAGSKGISFESLADSVAASMPKKALSPALDFHQREGRIRSVPCAGERRRWCVTDEGRAAHERLMSAKAAAA